MGADEGERMSRAVRFSEHGGPEVLEFAQMDEPHAGPGQVRVRVEAAGMNPYDSKVRSGLIPTTLPSGQGGEFAGVVDEVGADVDQVRTGDEVLGWTMAKAQADFVVVDQARVALKPDELDWATAGGLGLVANTAWRATASLGLGPDDTVLVTGAGGGVGILSAQFALAAGATVVGTARADDHEFLRGLGVIPVTYGNGELDALRAAAPAYTAALDGAGRRGVESALALGVAPARINSVADRAAGDELGIGNVGGGKKTAEELARFARDAASGSLVLPVQETFPFEDVAAAYRAFESTHVLGKFVLVAS